MVTVHICPVCQKSLSRSTTLRDHIKSHNQDKPFRCSKCPLRFTRNWDLKVHQDRHAGLKKYPCRGTPHDGRIVKGCDAAFHRKLDLEKHRKSSKASQCLLPATPSLDRDLVEQANAAETLTQLNIPFDSQSKQRNQPSAPVETSTSALTGFNRLPSLDLGAGRTISLHEDLLDLYHKDPQVPQQIHSLFRILQSSASVAGSNQTLDGNKEAQLLELAAARNRADVRLLEVAAPTEGIVLSVALLILIEACFGHESEISALIEKLAPSPETNFSPRINTIMWSTVSWFGETANVNETVDHISLSVFVTTITATFTDFLGRGWKPFDWNLIFPDIDVSTAPISGRTDNAALDNHRTSLTESDGVHVQPPSIRRVGIPEVDDWTAITLENIQNVALSDDYSTASQANTVTTGPHSVQEPHPVAITTSTGLLFETVANSARPVGSSAVSEPETFRSQSPSIRRAFRAEDLTCKDCSHVSKTPSDLKKHRAQHIAPYKCQRIDCPRFTKGFASINDLVWHVRVGHVRAGQPPVFKCLVPECPNPDKEWPRLDDIKQHMSQMHEEYNADDWALVSRVNSWSSWSR